jgi:hypothetical protein
MISMAESAQQVTVNAPRYRIRVGRCLMIKWWRRVICWMQQQNTITQFDSRVRYKRQAEYLNLNGKVPCRVSG